MSSVDVPDSAAYFSSYEDVQVHRLMLSDKPRVNAYKDAILSNKVAFEGSVVMDVGAGTGILSMFCALAGAKKVYAIEASSLAFAAADVIKENNYSDTVEVIHQRVEDVCLPNDVKVDIIVSEWMGFYLLHESMLDSVIAARDKFLRSGGNIFPNKAILYAAPCSTPLSLLAQMKREKEFWADVSGFQMKSIYSLIAREKLKTPEVSTLVGEHDLLTSGTKLFELDLSVVSTNELDLLEARKFVSVSRDGEYGGLCLWFVCEFPNLCEFHDEKSLSNSDVGDELVKNVQKNIILSTSPSCASTHWKQTLILWPSESIVTISGDNVSADGNDIACKESEKDSSIDVLHKWKVEDGEVVGFSLNLRRDSSCPRRYTIQLEALDPTEEEHPVPCECGTARCVVIAAFLARAESSSSSFSTDEECDDVDDT